jgi:RNA polymerase sigma-70 factor (ECF subfamily)
VAAEAQSLGPRPHGYGYPRQRGQWGRLLIRLETTDEELMLVLSQGDQEGLAELVRRYQSDLFRFCLHYLKDAERAKDLAQETFIRVYTARDRFDQTRKFRPWVLCIARNLCLNEIKRKKAVSMESLEEYASSSRDGSGGLFESSADGPDEQLATLERNDLVHKALAELDDESREIVKLRFFERLQAKEIADVIGSTEGAVRTRLHRILRSMQTRFQDLKEQL